jgi:hypothetical protein
VELRGGLILGAPCANGVTQHKVLQHKKNLKNNNKIKILKNQIFLMIHNEYLVGNP